MRHEKNMTKSHGEEDLFQVRTMQDKILVPDTREITEDFRLLKRTLRCKTQYLDVFQSKQSPKQV